jgi:RNA polymerase sigma factor (sigma-70 family)
MLHLHEDPEKARILDDARRFVSRFIPRRVPLGMEREDFAVEIELAVWRAGQSYRASTGKTLFNWAVLRGRGAIIQAERDHSLLTRTQFDKAARATSIPLVWQYPLSLEMLLWADDDVPSIAEALADPQDVAGEAEQREHAQDVQRCVRWLPHRERELVRRYYWKGETLAQIAGAFRVSYSRIHQLHHQALGRLRKMVSPAA